MRPLLSALLIFLKTLFHSRLALHLDPAPVVLDDAVGDGEAEARSLADLLRRVEEIEGLGDLLLAHPGPVVRDRDRQLAVDRGAADRNLALASGVAHRVHRVDQDVQEDLLELEGVTEDPRPGGKFDEDVDVFALDPVARQRQGATQYPLDVDCLR